MIITDFYSIHDIRLLHSNSDDRSRVLWHLVLPIPKHKDEAGKKDITSSEEVRVFTACPVFDGSVSCTDETCLDGNTDYTTD